MKVALVSHSPNLSGAEKMLVHIAVRLQRDFGVETHIFASRSGPMKDAVAHTGVRYHTLKNKIPWYLYVQDHKDMIAKHWRDVIKSANELTSRFRKLGIQCVIVNTLTSLPGMLAASRLNIPTIVRIAGLLNHVHRSGNLFKLACDFILVHSPSAVICPSQGLKDYYRDVRHDDIEVIPNFTNIPRQPPNYPTGTTVFSCLNSWEHHKGLEALVRAAAILKQKGCRFRLHLYGSGNREENIRKLIRHYKLQNRVLMLGRNYNISSIFQKTHALVTNSKIEAFGNTLLESMAHARPIIASNVSGHLVVLNQEQSHGFICKVDRPRAFAEKMEWVIRHREQAMEMGEKGYRIAKRHYNGEQSAKRLYTLISKVIQDNQKMSSVEVKNQYELCNLFHVLMNVLSCK